MMHAASREHGVPVSRRSGLRHDLARDWRRWTKAERIAAGCMLASLIAGVAIFVAKTAIGSLS